MDVVRVKDRLNNPEKSGYRDLLLNVRCSDHVCELQIHVKAFHVLKEPNHKNYEIVRVLPRLL